MTQLLQAFIRDYQDGAYPAEMLERFALTECLAHSEQGETLLALDLSTGEKAIIKCYARESDVGSQEAELLGSLNAPGIPRLLGEYTSPTLHCVARTWAEGRPLSDPQLRQTLTREQILDIGIKLCRLLTLMHQHKPSIIHRDVKPQNVILADDGKVSLIDFGISRAYKPDAESDTVFFGTQRFASPEQYGFRQTDCRSDIYSLGGVMMYLCTGTVQPERMRELITDKNLADVIARCMAFAPKDRYASAEDVRKALVALSAPGKRKRRVRATHWAALGVALLCALVGFAYQRGLGPFAPASYPFIEPMIEREVRLMLKLSDDEPISAESLANVECLYILADQCCADMNAYDQAMNAWYQTPDRANGTISSLADLESLPNLREVCLGAQRITDITPLAKALQLERVELRSNLIKDASPLGDHPVLLSVGLNDNPVGDLSVLASCPHLAFLDLCDASAYDPQFLESFSDFAFLDISNRTESYAFLKGKSIRELKVNYTTLNHLEWLADVSGLQTLEIAGTSVKSLEGLEAHQGLTSVRLTNTSISDYAPLLRVPSLQTVIVARAEAERIQPFAEQGGFEVVLE